MLETYVLGFMFDETKNFVALIQKNRPEWQKGKWNGIGGHIEKGETGEQAMVREFKEETGVITEINDWEYVCTMSKVRVFICEVFRSFAKESFLSRLKTMTDETVRVKPISTFIGDKSRISNLSWLMGMCLDDNDGFIDKYEVSGKVGLTRS